MEQVLQVLQGYDVCWESPCGGLAFPALFPSATASELVRQCVSGMEWRVV